MVKVGLEGEPLARAFGPVWASLAQSAPSAEWAAYGVACQLLTGPSELHIDCKAVLTVLAKQRGQQLSAKNIHAGY
eukprot:15387339-Heterocapsa_arctica.AAC.1